MTQEKKLIAKVLRKWNGTVFFQELDWDGVEDPRKCCDRYEREALGESYEVVDYEVCGLREFDA